LIAVEPVDNLSPENPQNLDFKRILGVFQGYLKSDNLARIYITEQRNAYKNPYRDLNETNYRRKITETITMSNTPQHSIYRRTLLKDAGSYIIPVMIVLAALLFSMGNIFSVNAAEHTANIPAPGSVSIPASPNTVTVSGSAGINLSNGAGFTIP
jgi:hypothetical protein